MSALTRNEMCVQVCATGRHAGVTRGSVVPGPVSRGQDSNYNHKEAVGARGKQVHRLCSWRNQRARSRCSDTPNRHGSHSTVGARRDDSSSAEHGRE
jgi:hypothetical protein